MCLCLNSSTNDSFFFCFFLIFFGIVLLRYFFPLDIGGSLAFGEAARISFSQDFKSENIFFDGVWLVPELISNYLNAFYSIVTLPKLTIGLVFFPYFLYNNFSINLSFIFQ